MAKNPKVIPAGVKPTSLSKNILSFLIDLGFTVLLMVGLYYSVGVPAILGSSDYAAMETSVNQTIRDAKLTQEVNGTFKAYVFQDDTTTTPENYAFKKYTDLIWNYFTIEIPGNPNLTADVTFTQNSVTTQGYKGEAKANDEAYCKWIYATFFGYQEASETKYFVPSVENDFTSKPTADDAQHTLLASMMYDTTAGKGFYPLALRHLQNQPYLLNCQSKMRADSYVATLPSFIAPALVFFFILPLCLPNGKTLGKLFLGVAVISFDGYRAKRIQIVVRQFTITLCWLLLALPWSVATYPLALLLMLIGFMSKVMSKKSQALHDIFAGTLSVDAKKSIWFASEEDEQLYKAQNPESPFARAERAEEKEAESAKISASIEAEERILDLSTIDKRRAEARAITSFDEFEKKSDAEFAAREAALREREIEGEEPVDEETEKAAFRDLAALEGLSEEEAAALAEEVGDEEPAKPDEPDDPDGFTDGAK